MIHEALTKVVLKEDLTETEMMEVMTEIMSGQVDPIVLSSFLTALKLKGETADEIAGAAKVMREKADKIEINDDHSIDTCGTGGDGASTFNISTGVAFVLATAGLKVVKHGNRSISSKCGSADVLEALNVNLELNKDQIKECVLNENIGFLFAPKHHQAMKYAMPVRQALGFRTIFNVLGPLSNPASAKYQLLGVYDEALTETMAKALQKVGVKRALVVQGKDGLDEISVAAETKVTELDHKDIKTYYIKPEDFGMRRGTLEDIKGGDKEENAKILINIFKGEQGAKRDILLLNSGAALYIANKAQSIQEGIELAKELIDSHKVYDKLESYVKYTEVMK
ncbi:anthranilate phosphoribosyltransferase [Natranaerovirga hydrolytica]|uniref:Anthranilate phosphoribosyltransferase n=1 Tax=Natranaerovirga hydrolytica TaxID=680378 RepID=A0A4R1MYK9_9FIRM|nr:anthranilate phosphoribosyltransferase [Natranaerovirga hydrolytica]TCK98225.1 anthranilate phosphoribosyltransferase [Natranaerovirga hydrolytica]